MTKICSKCKNNYPESKFVKDKTHSDNLSSQCKNCRSKKNIKYRLNNKQKLLKYGKAWRLKNPNYMPQYRVENKEKLTKQQNNYWNNRYKTDSTYKLINSLRNRILLAIKNNQKAGKTIDLIGCSVKKLKQHLESQFTNGMNWGSQGKWHIDHIKPCSSFNFKDPKQQQKCFHYSNLQPLWAKDNLSKSNKII